MESNLLRKDESDGSSPKSRNKRLDGAKQSEESSGEDQNFNRKGAAQMDEKRTPALTGFQQTRVIGKAKTDDLFEERLRSHEAEIKAFLAKHSELRLER